MPAPLRKLNASDRRLRIRLGEIIRRERLAAGISTTELADRVTVSDATVSRIESGLQTVSADLLGRIGQVLGVSPAELWPQEKNRPDK